MLVAWRRRRTPGECSGSPDEAGRLEVEISAPSGGTTAIEASLGQTAASERQPGRLQRAGTWLLAGSAILVGSLGAIYVSNPDPSGQGINFDYSVNQEAAHWVAIGAIALLLVGGLIRLGSQLRRRSKTEVPDRS